MPEEMNESDRFNLTENDKEILRLWAGEEVTSERQLRRPNRVYRYLRLQNRVASFVKTHLYLDYFVRRVVAGLLSIFLVISFLFILLRLIVPSDMYLVGLNYDTNAITPGTDQYHNLLQSRLHQFGLDGSLWTQLWKFWDNILPFHKKTILIRPSSQLLPDGSLTGFAEVKVWIYYGEVFTTAIGEKQALVTQIVKAGLPYSVAFAVISLVCAYTIGIPIGFYIAKKRGRRPDKMIGGATTLVQATPPVVLVLIIFYVATYIFNSHTVFSSGTVGTKVAPAIVMILFQLPYIINSVRNYVATELEQDYTQFSRSSGTTEMRIYWTHVLRNIVISLIRTIPISFMSTFFGISLLTETYWVIPGVSKLIVSGILNNEIFVVQTYLILLVACVSGLGILTDVVTASLNPIYRESNTV